jgi:hypothetical protein
MRPVGTSEFVGATEQVRGNLAAERPLSGRESSVDYGAVKQI